MIRVTFAVDKATEDREDDSPCIGSLLDPALKHPSEERWYLWLDGDRWPLSFCGHSASPLSQWRGWGAWVWRITSGKGEPLAGRWESCHVETCEEQIARLTAERDAWERSARDIAAGSDARGATIWRLQNRLSRWYRRFTRVDVALRQWKPLAQAWQARCEEAQAGERAEKARADAAEKRLAGLRAWAVQACDVLAAELLPAELPPHCWLRVAWFAVVRAVDASRPAAPEVDDDEPLTRGTRVRTVAHLTALFSPSLHPHRRPNALGKIVRRMTSGDIYYDVRHDDGTVAGYERSELIDLTADASRPGLTEEQAREIAEDVATSFNARWSIGLGQGPLKDMADRIEAGVLRASRGDTGPAPDPRATPHAGDPASPFAPGSLAAGSATEDRILDRKRGGK